MEIKNYRISAKYYIQRRERTFRKDIRAIDEKRALEKFYSILGAQNIKRNQIIILEIKEIPPEDIKDRKLQRIALSDEPTIFVE